MIFLHVQLENCIGSAVIAMGPERILTDVPITVNNDDLTCSNVWMVPILKNHVVGSSLEYYMQHILRLAKSFREAGRQGITLTFEQFYFFHDIGDCLDFFHSMPRTVS